MLHGIRRHHRSDRGRSRSRSSSRHRSHKHHKKRDESLSPSSRRRHEQKTSQGIRPQSEAAGSASADVSGDAPADFNFTAAQVAERIAEVCNSAKFRASSLEECFAPDVQVRHLFSSDVTLCDGAPAVAEAYARAIASAAAKPAIEVAKRIFLESDAPGDYSFAIDFIKAGGIAPWRAAAAAAPTVAVYAVKGSRVRELWTAADEEGVTDRAGLSKRAACASATAAAALALAQARAADGATLKVHFHDYANVPVIG
ncbi:hypothetical protein JKP88DRAFT_298832 [Tribonema minus]|uniref:Uncharacterized protein n=1 Tax=Tribonema minus TaxID=303371 RepID=A0A835ZB48_9STRA|nr:hypothetical protein JKP88DRAFT_298832 [Tribonema minus]